MVCHVQLVFEVDLPDVRPNVCGTTGQAPINRISSVANGISNGANTSSIANSFQPVGDLVALAAAQLGHRRGSGTTFDAGDEVCRIILCVLYPVPDTIIGAGEDRVGSSTLTSKLAAGEGWSTTLETGDQLCSVILSICKI